MIRMIVILAVLASPLEWIYEVDKGVCNGCGNCLYACSEGAISMVGADAYIDPDLCNGCGVCVNWCPRGAINKVWYTGIEESYVEFSDLVVSANPVSLGSFTVSGGDTAADVKLFTVAGRQVLSGDRDGSGLVSFDVSELSDGIYLVVSGNDLLSLTVAGSSI